MKHSTECISDNIWYIYFIYIYMKKITIINPFLDVKYIAVCLSDILLVKQNELKALPNEISW